MTWRLLAVMGLLVSTPSPIVQQPPSSPSLDFEFFRTRVQPVFTTKRPGNAVPAGAGNREPALRLLPCVRHADAVAAVAGRQRDVE